MIEILESPLFLQYIQILLGIVSIAFTIRIYVKQTKFETEKEAQTKEMEGHSLQMREGFGRLEKHLNNLEDIQDMQDDEVRELRDKVVKLETEVDFLKAEVKYLKTVKTNN